jgi:glyoxylase I family protein
MALPIEGVCTLLQVFDMPRSVAFYRDVLGFGVVNSSQPGDDFDWGLLRRGDAELMLNTQFERNKRPPAPDPRRVAGHADTALFFHCRDLDAAYAQLRDRGVDVKPPVVRAYGMTQLTFTDPDGYGICLQCPAPSGEPRTD